MAISSAKKKKSLKERSYPKRSKRKSRRNNQGEVTKKNARDNENNKLQNEIKGIVSIAIGIFLVISFQTNAAGLLGEFIANFFKGSFSSVALILPYYFMLYGVLLFIRRTSRFSPLCALLLFIGILIMNSSIRYSSDLQSYKMSTDLIVDLYSKGQLLEGAGLIGGIWTMFFIRIFGVVGTTIIGITIIIVSLVLMVGIPLSSSLKLFKFFKKDRKDKQEEEQQHFVIKNGNKIDNVQFNDDNNEPSFRAKALSNEKKIKIIDYMRDEKLFSNKGDNFEENSPVDGNNKPASKMVIPSSNNKDIKIDESSIKINTVNDVGDEYKFPPLSLLNKTRAKRDLNEREDLVAKAQKLEETLENFGVRAKVVEVSKGPTVTRYEVQPSPGVKVNSIVRLSDDIALNLQASSIRMEAPIPGKAAVGIEIQNDSNTLVTLRDVIETDEFKKFPSKIAFGIGKDISGNTVIADLAKMPHMLIAGATGSGKSVCINSIIISILYKAKPEEVKLLLIDPKVVELNVFNGIPHLLIPVVTDPSKAAAALNWAVQEMTSRYKNFAEESVRDLVSYNKKMKASGREAIPQVVIIIDELADLMMASPSQVEDAICRLAQMARAAGMHLVVATQRPSVDVITGVIKANIPSRIAFAVSALVDSRTILDSGGAEKLLGKGDMLFYPSGMAKPMRVQGSLIMEEEVENVVEYVKKQVSTTGYSDEVIDTIETSNVAYSNHEVDELLKETIELVVASQQASVSMIQRRFRVGYNRAARLMDEMEERGIVGPNEGSKPRRVLLSQEDLDELKEN